VDRLDPGMLLLADRAFDGGAFLETVRVQGAQFLVRMRAGRKLPRLALLPDGSILTRLGSVNARVIQAQVTAHLADGTRITGTCELATSLLDHRAHPAIELYHERWEIESGYLALRYTLLHGRVLRSNDPSGLEQELWALLTLYQVLRRAMIEAGRSRPGLDPDRASFTVAATTAAATVIRATGIKDQHDPDPATFGVIDLCSRELVGHAIAPHMRASLAVDAIIVAHRRNLLAGNVIMHTDRGSPYHAKIYRSALRCLDIRQSTGRTGSCLDGAAAESFFATIKAEIGIESWLDRASARRDIENRITAYNQRRLHSAIGYRTPTETRTAWQQRISTAA
jgi:transposase InsO family protein